VPEEESDQPMNRAERRKAFKERLSREQREEWKRKTNHGYARKSAASLKPKKQREDEE